MTVLEVRHDLENIVGESKYPATRFSEAVRDLFGAVDEFLVVCDVEEQRLGLFGGKAELSLVCLSASRWVNSPRLRPNQSGLRNRVLRPLQVLVRALS